MSFSIIYLTNRFFYRIGEFLRHWYVGGFQSISHQIFELLERLDRIFAFKVTIRHWLRPLYQDYTLAGYILGFAFRTARLFIAAIVYSFILAIAIAIYLIWAIIPLAIISRIFPAS